MLVKKYQKIRKGKLFFVKSFPFCIFRPKFFTKTGRVRPCKWTTPLFRIYLDNSAGRDDPEGLRPTIYHYRRVKKL
jgi:hypothetical protein